jgi:hypothetical protein
MKADIGWFVALMPNPVSCFGWTTSVSRRVSASSTFLCPRYRRLAIAHGGWGLAGAPSLAGRRSSRELQTCSEHAPPTLHHRIDHSVCGERQKVYPRQHGCQVLLSVADVLYVVGLCLQRI